MMQAAEVIVSGTYLLEPSSITDHLCFGTHWCFICQVLRGFGDLFLGFDPLNLAQNPAR